MLDDYIRVVHSGPCHPAAQEQTPGFEQTPFEHGTEHIARVKKRILQTSAIHTSRENIAHVRVVQSESVQSAVQLHTPGPVHVPLFWH